MAISRGEVTPIVQAAIMDSRFGKTPLNVAGLTVNIEDLAEDLRRFLLVQKELTRLHIYWPAVPVSRFNDADGDYRGMPVERAVPIDIPVDAAKSAGSIYEAVDEAQKQGISVFFTSHWEVRRTFLDGLGDIVFRRARWLSQPTAAITTTPVVTAKSSPAPQTVMWTKGHYFSVSTVFGDTEHRQPVAVGIYSFWLKSETPKTTLPLYDVHADTEVNM